MFAQNNTVFKEYKIVETFTAGIKLLGFEVKAVRKGKMNFKGGFVVMKGNDVLLINTHISPYQGANTPSSYDPKRARVLLLTAREKRKIMGVLAPSKDKSKKSSYQANYAVVPIKAFESHGLIKIEIGIGQGLKKFDKREKIKKEEINRTLQKNFKLSI